MTKIKTIKDIDVTGKRVLMRVDFNVPLDNEGNVTDDTRIRAALPTIQYLVERHAKVILVSHLGRPEGKDVQFSLKPVGSVLADKLGRPVAFVDDCIGEGVEAAVDVMMEGQVLLLENVRFYREEKKNDTGFAKSLASLADLYVNDAFGTAHRAHASTAGVTEFVEDKVAGFLIERELAFLGEKTATPERPFTVILGGAKVSDKISVIEALLDKADTILIGGAMAYTFQLAQGGKVGKSLSEPDKIETALSALKKAKEKGVRFLLPIDHKVVDSIDFRAGTVGQMKTVTGDIPDGLSGVDIGPETIVLYTDAIKSARTLLWNGPMGVFEITSCNKGTFSIAEAVVENSEATSIIGGGDSVKAINLSGYADKVTFMSTGGGASLEFLEGKVLPGVASLDTI